jgi:hypothetical protein
LTTLANPAANGWASSSSKPCKFMARPILKGVRFLLTIKSLGVATPKIAKVMRLYSGLIER